MPPPSASLAGAEVVEPAPQNSRPPVVGMFVVTSLLFCQVIEKSSPASSKPDAVPAQNARPKTDE